MPELPEVESARCVVHAVAADRTIVAVHLDEPDDIVLTAPPSALRAALLGARVTGTARRGKHLWLTLDGGRPCLLLHLGMTGSLRVPGAHTQRYRTGPDVSDPAWPPRFTKLRLRFDDGGQLAIANARRLGRVRLVADPLTEPPVSRLGFDPLTDLPDAADFAARLRRRRSPLKALLLDQAVAAGVGNWIADEVLYQAGIDPRRRPAELGDAELEALRVALREVVRAAVAVDADSDRFPPGWLFHRRWGRDEAATDAAGHPLRFDRVGGRTTAWVPAVQR